MKIFIFKVSFDNLYPMINKLIFQKTFTLLNKFFEMHSHMYKDKPKLDITESLFDFNDDTIQNVKFVCEANQQFLDIFQMAINKIDLQIENQEQFETNLNRIVRLTFQKFKQNFSKGKSEENFEKKEMNIDENTITQDKIKNIRDNRLSSINNGGPNLENLKQIVYDIQNKQPQNISLLAPKDIIFYNFTNFEIQQQKEFSQMSFIKLFELYLRFIESYWHYVNFSFLILYYFVYQGCVFLLFPILIFTVILVDIRRTTAFVWKFILVVFTLLVILKNMLYFKYFQSSDPNTRIQDQAYIAFYLGSSDNLIISIVILFSLIFSINSMLLNGNIDISFMEHENVFEAYIGLKLIKDLKQDDFDEQNEDEINEAHKQAYQHCQQFFIQKFAQLDKKNLTNFIFRNFSIFSVKSGKNQNWWSALLNIIICFYIIVFYQNMEFNTINSTISRDFKNSSFSGKMVIFLFLHLIIVFKDHLFILISYPLFSLKKYEEAVQNQKIQLYSYIAWIFTVIFIHYYLLFYISNGGQFKIQLLCDLDEDLNYITSCQYVVINNYVMFLYFLYCIYFFLNAKSIKNGIDDLSSKKKEYSYYASLYQIIWRSIPFLFELKVFLEWTFTKTSLTLVEWINVQDINDKLFQAKCSSEYFNQKNHGMVQSKFIKFFVGGCGYFLLILLIFVPMLLFSNLNPITSKNSVISAINHLQLVVNKTNEFPLYQSSHIVNLTQINDQNFTYLQNNYEFLGLSKDYIQQFYYTPYSDNNWQISYPTLEVLKQNLDDSVNKGNFNYSIYEIKFDYQINREYEQVGQSTFLSYQIKDVSILKNLYDLVVDCNSDPVYIEDFYIKVIELYSDHQPSPLKNNEKDDYLNQDIYLNRQCVTDNITSYWTFSTNVNGTQGIEFITILDKYSPTTYGYSIFTFYISIVYVVGKFMRMALTGDSNYLLTILPNPDDIMRIVESILVARADGDFEKEQILYYYLLDLLRSPEIVKQISGSLIQQYELLRKYKIE